MNLLNKEFDLEFLKSRFSDADFYFLFLMMTHLIFHA